MRGTHKETRLFDARRRSLCIAGSLLIGGCASSSVKTPPLAEIAPSGKLRAAINYGNPVLARRGANGEPEGVSVDLAREASRRLGVPVELVPVAAAGNAVE